MSFSQPERHFSDRELEVLRCLAKGLSNEKIANRLFISVNTVKTHVQHIYLKLEVNNRTEACSKALLKGIIDLSGV